MNSYTSTPNTICAQSFRAAIALSNTGVTLLERQSFRHAMSVFKDALTLVRAAFQGYPTNDESNVLQALHKASQYLVEQPQPENPLSERMELIVLLDVQSPEDALASIYGTAGVVIRIDDSRYEDPATSIDIEAAIIMSNYGVACRFLHQISVPHTQLLREASNLLHMSYGILSRQLTISSLSYEAMASEGILFVCLSTILQNLINVSDQLAMPLQHRTYTHEFRTLRTRASMLRSNSWDYFYSRTAAAA